MSYHDFFGPNFRTHTHTYSLSTAQGRSRCRVSHAEEHSRICHFTTAAACRGRGGGCHRARGPFYCCEREWIHVEPRRRGNIHHTSCTGVPRFLSPTPSRRAKSRWRDALDDSGIRLAWDVGPPSSGANGYWVSRQSVFFMKRRLTVDYNYTRSRLGSWFQL